MDTAPTNPSPNDHASTDESALFPGFISRWLDTPRGPIRARIGGDGPPVLLLHGYPQTHLMWHGVASALADRFTVVAADLPGYGGSFAPPVTADHSAFSKRALAGDLVAAMRSLGHQRFALAGHDRGGRVAYRMALDHPDVVTRLVVLDIVPTGEVWARADAGFATGYWHWGFLAQPAPLPERLINADPDGYWISVTRLGLPDPADDSTGRRDRYPAETLTAYRAQFNDPAFVTSICEDYRAGAGIDRTHDDADRGVRTIGCPVRVLWGADGSLPRFYGDPLQPWLSLAPNATGRGVEQARHFLVEDQPDVLAAELIAALG